MCSSLSAVTALNVQCPVGSYNAGGNRDECTPCQWGLTTADNATLQVDAASCRAGPGFQANNDLQVQECPAGESTLQHLSCSA